MAYNSVNTAPVDTIKAFVKASKERALLPIDKVVIEKHFEKVASLGIDMEEILQKLIDDGLDAFKEAFSEILEAL